jgi:hypothetical protein
MNTTNIFQILYLSFAEEHIYKTIDVELANILENSRISNISNNITGMLVYHEGAFIQLIEGDKESIVSLFGRIALDTRHKDLKILLKRESPERIFTDWSMAHKKIEEEDMNTINNIFSWDKIMTGRSVEEILDQSLSDNESINQKIIEVFKMFKSSL